MHLVSRVDKSGMIDARKHLMSPVTQILLSVAVIAFFGTGIAGFIESGNMEKFSVVMLMALVLIGVCTVVPYLIAVGSFERMKLLYESDVLNRHVYFDDDEIRIVGLDHDEIERVSYSDVTKCVKVGNSIVLIIGWQVFMFNEQQTVAVGLVEQLAKNGIKIHR